MGQSTVIRAIDTNPATLKALKEALEHVESRDTGESNAELALTGQSEHVSLPGSVLEAMFAVVQALSRGKAITLVSEDAVMTTTEAADLLMVSRPHITKLIDEGAIPSHKVGTHRRVRYIDVIEYGKTRDSKRLGDLGAFSRLALELEGDYR